MLTRRQAVDRRKAFKLNEQHSSIDESYMRPPWRCDEALYGVPLRSLTQCLEAWSLVDQNVKYSLLRVIEGYSISDEFINCERENVINAIRSLTGFNDALDRLLDDVTDNLKL